MEKKKEIELEAIILAGGLGTRLKTVIADLPKPMAMVNRQPFLNYILNFLSKNQIKKVILATGHLHHKIEEYYGDNYRNIQIEYSIETRPLGTGGCIKKAFSKVTAEKILIMNGDSFFNFDLGEMVEVHRKNRADLTLALRPMHDISRYGVVKMDSTRVVRFEEKKQVDFGYINAGVYLAQHTLFDNFDLPEQFSIEEDFFKKYTTQLNLHACISDGYFIDIGIPEDYKRAQQEMMEYG